MPEGERRLRSALESLLRTKQDRPQVYPGLMGAYVDGVASVKVAGRADFVWVRLRGVQSEPIMAFNDKVGEHFDLPVLVYREPENPHLWRIYARDVSKYQSWGGASYLPPHGRTHSLSGDEGAGSDIVWVQKSQFLPMLPHPNNSGSMSIFIEPEAYLWNGEYRYFPGTGSASFQTYKPTGTFTSRFVTVYLRGSDGTLQYLRGAEYPASFPPNNIWSYIAVPAPDEGFPIAAVNLFTGTQRIGWREVYDLRLLPGPILGTGSLVGAYDEGLPLGRVAEFDFVGAGVVATRSGTRGRVAIAGGEGGVDQIGVYGLDDGVPLGTGSSLDFGDNLNVSISGARIRIDAQAGGATGTVVLYDEDTFVGLFEELRFKGAGVAVTNSGSYAAIDIPAGAPGPAGPPGAFGVFGLDDGVPRGTGTSIDVGYGLGLSISGTRLHLEVEAPVTGSIVVSEEGQVLGSVTHLDYRGDRLLVTVSGSYGIVRVLPPGVDQIGISLVSNAGAFLNTGVFLRAGYGLETIFTSLNPNRATIFVTPPVTGSFVLSDEGAILGSVTQFDVRGARIVATISGSYGTIIVSPEPQEQIGVYGLDDGVPLGTGSSLDFGDNLNVSISGARIRIDAQAGGATGTVVLYDEDTFVGLFEELRFKGAGVAVTNSGSYAAIDIPAGAPGPAGPPGAFGVFGLDDGVPRGTGTSIDFGDNLTATISGSRIRVDATAGGAATGTVVIYDEDTFVGVFEEVRFKGAGVAAYNSGSYAAIDIPGGGGIVLSKNEGVPVGTANAIDVKGDYLAIAITGSQGFLQGNAWPDRYPISGSVYDLEFEGANGNFSIFDFMSTGAVALDRMDINYRWPSYIHVFMPNANANLDLGKQISRGSGTTSAFDFSVTLKATVAGQANYQAAHIFVMDNPVAAEQKYGYRVGYEASANQLNLSRIVNGVWAYNFQNLVIGRVNTIYLHFQRKAGANWAFGSMNGMSWWQIGPSNTMVYDAKWFLGSLWQNGVNLAFHGGFDWMRVNHLDLLV